MRLLLVIAATLLLAACGWQLRGTPQYLALESLTLDGPSYELRRRLELALEESGVAVHGDSERRLAILNERWDRRTVAVDAQGRAAEIELRYGFNWQLRSRNGETRTPSRRINLVRNFNFDAANATAASDEERATRQEMFEDATWQLLRQLDAVSGQLIDHDLLDTNALPNGDRGAAPRPDSTPQAGDAL
ncbi:LPS assembly lipoprotein LptE [Isoalcanivorax indicus]|uniref:LPS-assembly lipoprotein LptE n=1 Tax=Isoalcanivorax indicus TaxID=2202653 RepID=UPI000DB90C2A|nr:LPS assembly lipoprotein LptE [Isoalcanivorax indicus]